MVGNGVPTTLMKQWRVTLRDNRYFDPSGSTHNDITLIPEWRPLAREGRDNTLTREISSH